MLLMGLREREVAHASSLWLQGDGRYLHIPRMQPCDCKSCRRRPINARYRGTTVGAQRRDDEPMYGADKMLLERTIDLTRLGSEGQWLSNYLRGRGRQVGWQHNDVGAVVRSVGLAPSVLRDWAGMYLTHRHGLDLQTVAAWRGEGVAVDINLRTSKAWEDLGKVYGNLLSY